MAINQKIHAENRVILTSPSWKYQFVCWAKEFGNTENSKHSSEWASWESFPWCPFAFNCCVGKTNHIIALQTCFSSELYNCQPHQGKNQLSSTIKQVVYFHVGDEKLTQFIWPLVMSRKCQSISDGRASLSTFYHSNPLVRVRLYWLYWNVHQQAEDSFMRCIKLFLSTDSSPFTIICLTMSCEC